MSLALFDIIALISLLPAALLAARRELKPDSLFWLSVGLGVAGPLLRVAMETGLTWHTGLAPTLWSTVAAVMAVYAVACAVQRDAWRLAPLLAPLMMIVGLFATLSRHALGEVMTMAEIGAWAGVHIAAAVITYALVTIAAVAALAATVQERALKRKRPTWFTRPLPSVADAETLVVGLLKAAFAILAIGLATGMALQIRDTGSLLAFNHKILLTIAAFVVIGVLLLCHFRAGVRGRLAARLVLLAYLLMTLGYPGVKFVTEVLLA